MTYAFKEQLSSPDGGIMVLPETGGSEKTELLSAALGQPVPLCYGRHVVGGNMIFQQINSSTNETTYMIALGEGEWEEAEVIWVNGNMIYQNTGSLDSTTFVHFHPGLDGTLGEESDPETRNQKICSFWPPLFTPRLTFSRLAYISIRLANDIDAPENTLDIRGIYKTRKIRIFDAEGTQTAYEYSANPAWCTLDLIIHRKLKPHGLINEALTAGEKAQIDFTSFYASAQYCAADPGDGKARFESHLAFTEQSSLQQSINQMLLTCRGYLIDKNGKIALYCDQPRSSVFSVTRDMIVEGSLSYPRKDTRDLANSFKLKYRHLESGDTDHSKDFQVVEPDYNDDEHQDATDREIPVTIDIGNSLPGRAARLGKYIRDRSLQLVDQAKLQLLTYNNPNTGRNDFSGDSSWVAVYRMDENALTVDESPNGNTLTNVGVIYNNGADFEASESDYMCRADADLSSGFPGKYGTENKDLALSIRFTPESTPPAVMEGHTYAAKFTHLGTPKQLSYALYYYYDAQNYKLFLMTDDGAGDIGYIILYSGSSLLAPATQYHFGFSFQNSTKAWLAKIRNLDTNNVVLNASGTSAYNMVVSGAAIGIGCLKHDASVSHHFDGIIRELAISNTPKTEANFDALAAGIYGAIPNYTIDLLPGDLITGPKDVDAWETQDYEVLEISDEPDGSRSAFLQKYDEDVFFEDTANPTMIYPTDWDMARLNPSGAADLEILTMREDPKIPAFGMAFEFTPDDDNGAPIEGVAVVLSKELPAEGPYDTERAAFPAKTIEDGVCQIIKGSREIVVERADDDTVLGKVFLIYSDDPSPDTDLDGTFVEDQGTDRIKLAIPLQKSGIYSYSIIYPWWPPEDTSNILYRWFPIEQIMAFAKKGNKIATNEWGQQAAKWRTPAILAPSGKHYATLYSKNAYGLGTRLTSGANYITITFDGVVTTDTDIPSGCSALQILTNAQDSTIPKGCMAFRFNRDTSNYKSVYAVEVSMGLSPPLHGPYAAQRAAHPTDILADGDDVTIEGGNTIVNVTISDPAPPGLEGNFFLILDGSGNPINAEGIKVHASNYLELTTAFFWDGVFDWVAIKPWWTLNEWDHIFMVPADFKIANVEETVWQTKPVPIFQGANMYAQLYSINIWGLSN